MCKPTASELAGDGKAVQQALDSIAALEQTTNPALATQLTNAGQAIANTTAVWKTGDPVDDVNTAAIVAEQVLALIPPLAPYATFIAIAVAALDVIIGNLSTQSAQTGNVVSDALKVRSAVKALPANPYRGLVQIHRHFLQNYRSAFVDRWNEQVDFEPTLGIAKL